MSTTAPAMNHNAITLSGAIMVAAVVVVFLLFVFFLIFYIRSNFHLGIVRTHENSNTHFAGGNQPSVFRRALSPAVLKSLPVAVFSAKDFKDGFECAVCISEITDGELFRLLPGCRHGFHLDCIDLWFSSNSTCPVCRSSVELPKRVSLKNVEQTCDVNTRPLQVDCSGEGSSRRSSGLQVKVLMPINEMESSSLSLQSSGIPAVVGEEHRGWEVGGRPPPVAVVGASAARVEGEKQGSSSS
ncbi:RING-H2 finger protein ATL60-like [Phalaenopsis equestris]|uniref:RING-H2 finger protein ATL60-like n=1 Tax=Phalaenopsis equestris TaxID=78828 RepID=UPI0009E52964|nr:RING-H2 finger protein ATL60-like [Phalaenopsis equestris]